jgi:hypothetical protein
MLAPQPGLSQPRRSLPPHRSVQLLGQFWGGFFSFFPFFFFFPVFGIRTALRHGTQIEATETALSTSGLRRISISWSELDHLKLAYYSTRRDRREGWLQLELRAGSSTLRLDSRIGGFADLVQASARAAELRGLSFSPATAANLQALGVRFSADETDFREKAGEAA